MTSEEASLPWSLGIGTLLGIGTWDLELSPMKLPQHTPRLTVPVSERDHTQGPADAPVTLLEYGDYECPYCGSAYPIVKRLQEEMGDKLRFVFRNFPLNTIHEHAGVAA